MHRVLAQEDRGRHGAALGVAADVEAIEVFVGTPARLLLNGLPLAGREPDFAHEESLGPGELPGEDVAVGGEENGRRDVGAGRGGQHERGENGGAAHGADHGWASLASQSCQSEINAINV